MNAAQAAGQTVSQGIGLYADGKRKDAIDAAKAAYERGDLVAMQSYIDQAKSWDEGGASRAGLQATGGALIGGLGGGSVLTAIGGAAGAGTSSLLAAGREDQQIGGRYDRFVAGRQHRCERCGNGRWRTGGRQCGRGNGIERRALQRRQRPPKNG
ncbi:hemagglutination activity domain protein [Burkholderia pseudomallei MSHR7343]|nr:hemagglutination activity domain protein [Burkholderia pseudomallei MSHR7343]